MPQRRHFPFFCALSIGAFASPSLALPPSAIGASADFWKHWGDGKAEIDGYALTQPRYGSLRAATSVLIFVTEDFSDSLRVKADPGKHPASDVYPVIKLNSVREFQTGIYDYHVLTSTFLRVSSTPPMAPVKVSFSSQEWCGNVFVEWIARGDRLDGSTHSYFDGEADQSPSHPLPPGGILEDAIPILVRELRGALVAPGEARTVAFFPSTIGARLGHRAQSWGEATVSRSAGSAPVVSSLGRTSAHQMIVAEKGGQTTTWAIEDAPPHRILGWSSTTGEAATLVGSARLPYWQLNRPGDESQLKLLGLSPLPAPHKNK